QNDCSIPYAQPNRYQPVIASRTRGLLYPVNSWSIEVQKGETVDIVCPGFNNVLNGTQLPYLSATCQEDGTLPQPPGLSLNCKQSIRNIVSETSKKCGSRGDSKVFQIGWSLPHQGISSLMEVCVNVGSFSTEYSKHILFGSMYNGTDVIWKRRHMFIPPFPYRKAYREQNQTLAALLGSTTLANAYMYGWGRESFLSKGHLCPSADFNIQTWRDATFHYINAVPQWQAFNGGNWKDLEDSVKIKSRTPTPRDLVIYTGAHEVLKLPDVNKNPTRIFLLNATQNSNSLAVPEKMWKIVLDEQKKEGVAFVLLNIPFNPKYPIPDPTPLCPDVCDEITWVQWTDRKNGTKGKIYCCTVDSFVKNIPNLPIPGNFSLMK
ncbi:hypothetical protein J437_LFUL017043, partial [Ladona fulva]